MQVLPLSIESPTALSLLARCPSEWVNWDGGTGGLVWPESDEADVGRS